MKRGLIYAAVLVAAVLLLNREGTAGIDIGKLEPACVLMVEEQAGIVKISTDLGHWGCGDDLAAAVNDMKQGAAGAVFLDTTEYLLLTPMSMGRLDELCALLRNSCQLCVAGEVKMEDLAAVGDYLAVHEPGVTLGDWRKGEYDLPILYMEGDRMELAYP